MRGYILVLVSACLLLTGCGGGKDEPSVIREIKEGEASVVREVKKAAPIESIEFDFKEAKTKGNHTFLPLPLQKGVAGVHHEIILEVLDKWERTHPELEMVDWDPESSSAGTTLGLWIYHRPRDPSKIKLEQEESIAK
jgi:hypothetical protein